MRVTIDLCGMCSAYVQIHREKEAAGVPGFSVVAAMQHMLEERCPVCFSSIVLTAPEYAERMRSRSGN
jgi:hypothetical protein